MKTKLLFAFDVVCPFAFVASLLMEKLEKECQIEVEFRPVLLGGLFEQTEAPQGKHGSATDAMPASKRAFVQRDLQRVLHEHHIQLKFPANHPQSTVRAMQYLAALDTESSRRALARHLYRAYWLHHLDLSNPSILHICCKQASISIPSPSQLSQARQTLRQHTAHLVQHGGFGVPSFITLPEHRLVYGLDRLPILHHILHSSRSYPPSPSLSSTPFRNLLFYIDFASPYCYLAWTQRHRLFPLAKHVQLVPIVLGIVFREVGTPNLPGDSLPLNKRWYVKRDLEDWANLWGETLRFSSYFPLRTPLALKVALIEIGVVDAVFVAAWRDDRDISKREVLVDVLEKAGWDGERLVKEAEEKPEVGRQLRTNTQEAIQKGVFGVPTFQVDQLPLVWGQDRLHVVMQQLCDSSVTAKL